MSCDRFVNCPAPASYPLLGYSAEADDVPTFTAMGFGPVTPPPLNWTVGQPTGFAIAMSTVSPEAAFAAANTEAIANAHATWTPPGEVPAIVPGDQDIAGLLDSLDVPPLI